MKLNYSTLALTILAVVLGTQRSDAQEGFAPMGSPYPAGTAGPHPGMMQPGYAPGGQFGDPNYPVAPVGYGAPMMGGMPAAYQPTPAAPPMPGAPAPAGPAPGAAPYTQGQPYMMDGQPYVEGADGIMYEQGGQYQTAGDYVQYDNYAGGYGSCADGSCGDGCALPPRAYGAFDTMLMWRKGANFPMSVTTSDPADEGILGAPSTQVLFGNTAQDDPEIGFRLTMGLWLDDYQDWSVGGRFMILGESDQTFSTNTAANPVIAFPFYNVNTMMNDSIVVSLPGNGANAANNATVNMTSTNEVFTGDLFVTKHLWTNFGNRFDFVTGYSYAKIDDSYTGFAQYTTQDTGGTLPVNTVVTLNDSIAATNEFHGGQFGLIAEYQDGPFVWRSLGKISIGNMRQTAAVNGSFLVNGTQISNNGIYARASNSGSFQRDVFAYVPEFNSDLIYALNCNWDFKIGCTFVYFSDVVTGGSLINQNIDPNGVSGDPQFMFEEQDFWVLGMNFGAEYHY